MVHFYNYIFTFPSLYSLVQKDKVLFQEFFKYNFSTIPCLKIALLFKTAICNRQKLSQGYNAQTFNLVMGSTLFRNMFFCDASLIYANHC